MKEIQNQSNLLYNNLSTLNDDKSLIHNKTNFTNQIKNQTVTHDVFSSLWKETKNLQNKSLSNLNKEINNKQQFSLESRDKLSK